MSISRALLSISLWVTSKGAPTLGSPHRAPSERVAAFLEPSFIHLSMSLLYEPPSRFPSGPPMEWDACLQSLFFISCRVPSNKGPPPGFLHRALSKRERFSTSRVPFIHLSKSLVNELPSRFPCGAPMGRDARLQSLSTQPSESPVKEPPYRFSIQSTHRERCSFSRALLQLSQSSWWTPPPGLLMGSLWREVPVSVTFYT